jgi:hypothetical protein
MNYSASNFIEPFYSENNGFKTGRDALGVQSASIALYARLLPGMTNLTLRLRYYSFYSWLLKEYDKLPIPAHEKTLDHHHKYIRRAELILAFTMVNLHPSVTGVIGSRYVNEHLIDLEKYGFYNIQKGADKIKKKDRPHEDIKDQDLYWDQAAGALGQYYSSSMAGMGLSETLDHFFHILPPGRRLASAFEKNVSKEARDKFKLIIKNGKLFYEDIHEIQDFSLNQIPVHSEEWTFLVKMLKQDDGPDLQTSDEKVSFKRKETMFLYLDFLRSGYSSYLRFEQFIFKSLTQATKSNGAFFGWAYYHLSEASHYALETIFWAILVNLDGRFLPVNYFIKEIEEIIIQENCRRLTVTENTKYLDVILASESFSLLEKQTELEYLTRSEENRTEALSKAVEMLSLIYLEVEPMMKQVKEFEILNSLQHQQGSVSHIMEMYVTKHFDLTYSNYVSKIIKFLINNHISTAYRKMGSNDANLLKFVIEDNIIGHIQTMSPRYTNPRLKALEHFLNDLNLIDSNNIITSLGNEVIEQEMN